MDKDQVIQFLKENNTKPYIEMTLMEELGVEPIDRSTFIAVLEQMEEQGLIIKTKKGKYALPEFFGIYVGKLQIAQRGFGFVIVENVPMMDVFVPSSLLYGAMNGDRVMVKLTKVGGPTQKSEGEVIKVIERAHTTVVGIYQQSKSFGFVIPDDPKIKNDVFVSKSQTLGAKEGDKVVVQITKYAEERRNPEGKIIEILGQVGAPGVDILSVIRTYNLPETFNHRTLEEADVVPLEVSQEEVLLRDDFRNERIFTIDGKDAKDLDDAVHIKKLDNGHYELGVHIADVSYYVTEKSKLDKEALKRGTSVYLLNRVIPMLPERLSNGICSLNPHVERLTLSCVMEIDNKGDVVSHRISEGLIKSVERMNYDDVSDMIEGKADSALISRYKEIHEDILLMAKLSDILHQKRVRRGAIDFDFAETKIKLDGEGKPIWVGKAERRTGHRLIESFMLVANETVAEQFFWLELPFVYRVHENPKPEKIETLNKFLYHFGYKIKGSGEDIHPKAVQQLIEEVTGKKEEHVISKMTLRSLKQAKYLAYNQGHFGLAAKYYCHFTSPIRRYPDLQIHRIIREMLRGELTAHRVETLRKILPEVAQQSSERERNAELAERDVNDMKMAEYMLGFIGEKFSGVISSITSFGMFVELENTIEGLIRLEDMDDDFYHFDESRMQLQGERSKRVFALGDAVEIVVVDSNPVLRQISFELA